MIAFAERGLRPVRVVVGHPQRLLCATSAHSSRAATRANLRSAIRLAERLGAGHRVVTVQVDSGMKYLGGDLYKT